MDAWIDTVSSTLGITSEVEVDQILDTARDAARYVSGPAAPVTTYLLGYAAGAGGDSAKAARDIKRLAKAWAREHARV